MTLTPIADLTGPSMSDSDLADLVNEVGGANDFADALDAKYGSGGGSGGSELADAANRTGNATTILTTATAIPGCTIVIPATTRPVQLQWGCLWGTTAVSQGLLYSLVYESTGGGAVAMDSEFTRVSAMDPVTTLLSQHRGSTRLDPSTITRSFILFGQVVREGGSATLAAYVRNLTTRTGCSYLKAVEL